jgi:hypothetical protein
MQNRYDMQRQVVEALFDLIDDITRHGDVFRLDAFQRELSEAEGFFGNDSSAYQSLREFAKRAARFKQLKATNDKVLDGDPINEREHEEEDWLLAQADVLKDRFKRFLQS